MKNILNFKTFEYINGMDLELENIKDVIEFTSLKLGIDKKNVCDILKKGYEHVIGKNEKFISYVDKIYLSINNNIHTSLYFPTYINILDVVEYIIPRLKINGKQAIDILIYGYKNTMLELDEELISSLNKAKDCLNRLKLKK